MYKIKKISFENHPVLGNMTLDFCDKHGNAADTVIFAGENGSGKSTILNAIYGLTDRSASTETAIITDGTMDYQYSFKHFPNNSTQTIVNELGSGKMVPFVNLTGIFSDVEINFHAAPVSSVTSTNLDSSTHSKKSSFDLPREIQQLFVDIQNLDDADVSKAVRDNPGKPFCEMSIDLRMPRFTNAFGTMFDNMNYSHIGNDSQHKVILFKKGDAIIPLDSLSSGEKQIVYRGCYLLKDINALKGAFVFIDEPEISLHPEWQKKILDYYKNIFTDQAGVQTSQLFIATHSPFIIHNDRRKNDKVIVLARSSTGEIVVKDKPQYYKCNSSELVEDAFSIGDFSPQGKPVVYLEGRTDELYFLHTVEAYDMTVPFDLKWIGYIDENGQEANTGKPGLDKAVTFLTGQTPQNPVICLYDSDANKSDRDYSNLFIRSLPEYENSKNITSGIENAIEFGDIDIEPFKEQKISRDGYNIEKRIPEFRKMECCQFLCSLDQEKKKEVFIHLKETLDRMIDLINAQQ